MNNYLTLRTKPKSIFLLEDIVWYWNTASVVPLMTLITFHHLKLPDFIISLKVKHSTFTMYRDFYQWIFWDVFMLPFYLGKGLSNLWLLRQENRCDGIVLTLNITLVGSPLKRSSTEKQPQIHHSYWSLCLLLDRLHRGYGFISLCVKNGCCLPLNTGWYPTMKVTINQLDSWVWRINCGHKNPVIRVM